MTRLIAAYRWEALLVVGLVCSYVAVVQVARVAVVALTLLALRAVLMGVLYSRLRRLGYGLEFALLAAIPFAAGLASISYSLAIPYLADLGLDALNLVLIRRLPAPLTAAILLAVLYPYVRRARGGIIERASGLLLAVAVVKLAILAYQLAPDLRIPTLYVTAALLLAAYAYIWRLRLNLIKLVCAATFAAAIVHLVCAAPDLPAEISTYAWRFIHSNSARFLAGELAAMLLALWFARSASKLSLAHAFFITALVFTFPLSRLLIESSIGQSGTLSQPLALSAVTATTAMAALSIVTNLAAVWLLGNFDRRGAAFNARAAAALFGIKAAIGVAAAIPLLARGDAAIAGDAPTLIVFAGWGVTLVLVYLLRVRQPAPAPGSA